MSDPPTTASSGYYVDTDAANITNTTRRSRLFFGLCDMRTATVALDVLNIGFTVVVVLVLSLMYLLQGGPFVFQNIMGAIGAGIVTASVSAVGLWASMNWQLKGLYAATAGFFSVLIWRLVHLDWVDIIVNALLLYPHFFLTMEMRAGIMTPETFDQEEYLTEGGRDFVEMAHQYISPKNGKESVTGGNDNGGGAMA